SRVAACCAHRGPGRVAPSVPRGSVRRGATRPKAQRGVPYGALGRLPSAQLSCERGAGRRPYPSRRTSHASRISTRVAARTMVTKVLMAESLRSSRSRHEWQDCPCSQDFCHTGQMIQKVAAIVVPGVSIFELAVPCEVFGIDRTDTGGPSFDFVTCAPEPGVVEAKAGGVDVVVEHGLEAARDADVVIMTA